MRSDRSFLLGMKKAIVFIDGNNFYYRLKYLTREFKRTPLLKFSYREFCKWLCKDFELVDIRYYIGAVKQKKNNLKARRCMQINKDCLRS